MTSVCSDTFAASGRTCSSSTSPDASFLSSPAETRDDLERAGHRFRTRSDTEVIVHAYEEWGIDAFRRFNGQWAIALWDALSSTLVLARDPFGVRPLYMAERAGLFIIISIILILAIIVGIEELRGRIVACDCQAR